MFKPNSLEACRVPGSRRLHPGALRCPVLSRHIGKMLFFSIMHEKVPSIKTPGSQKLFYFLPMHEITLENGVETQVQHSCTVRGRRGKRMNSTPCKTPNTGDRLVFVSYRPAFCFCLCLSQVHSWGQVTELSRPRFLFYLQNSYDARFSVCYQD